MTDAESTMLRLLTAIESRIARIEKDVHWLRQRDETMTSEAQATRRGAASDTLREHDVALDATMHPPGERH